MFRVFLVLIFFTFAFADDSEIGKEAYNKCNYHKAFKHFKKSCDLNNGLDCSNLGFLYKKGQGVKQDYNKAREYCKKSCDLNNEAGCFLLGHIYENGKGVRQDRLTAKELYGKSCDLGFQLGCDNYKRLNN